MSEERKHHDYSPSSLEMLEACPCFRNRQSAKQHERTIAGTKAHAVAESRTDDSSLSDDDAEAVAECLDLVERRKTLMNEARARAVKELADELEGNHTYKSGAVQEAEGIIDPVLEMLEYYWPIDEEIFSDGVKSTTAGYSDVVLISHDRKKAEVLDYKYGHWQVSDAKHNLQGIAYGLGVFKQFSSVEQVEVFFIQPLINYTTSATFKRSEIPELYLRIQVVVARAREARARNDFSTASPKVPVCSFCQHIGTCPKVSEFALTVGSKFAPLQFPESLTPTQLHDPKNASIGIRLAQVLKTWCEAFRSQVTENVLARRCELPEGFRIESRSERQIVDMGKLKEIALNYLTQQEYDSTLSTTFGSLEDLISEKAPRGSKKAAIEAFKQNLEESGAVQKSESFVFLKAITVKK